MADTAVRGARRARAHAARSRRRPRGGAWLVGGLVALLLAQLVVAQPAAAVEACRTRSPGTELPDGAGPYPLIDQLGLRQAWDLATGSGVLVAVVDSGVDAEHPDLDGAVRRGSTYEGVNDEREFDRTTPAAQEDCEGHGTAVAGLVAARRAEGDRMAGVAPAATVYPVRVAGGIERATVGTIAAAIGDAVDSGARVLNLSFALPTDYEPIREAVARAVAEDVVVVAAAGNEGNQGVSGGHMYPAAYDGVLAVGAVGNDGQPMDVSNAGPWVDLAGYGEEMAVVAPEGSGYRVESGTSFAAAQVSGAAALVLSRFPDLPAAEVARRLTESATQVGGGVNDRTGAGIVDPFGALTHLSGDTDSAGEAAPPGHIPVQPIPTSEPLLSATAATALAWSGGLLLAVVLGLAAAPAVRRAAARGWRAGPDPRPAPGTERPANPPPGRLDWLDGSESPSTTSSAQPSRNRTR
ncbi:S8 family serine peptidase [Streptomyces millisiae]|uniref:S8 family serine peptidase n=1 Tax=Streptomyces millisiae TaxID=3075542 RepID=A0ABU2LU93_9ACTN|nr:S8 family serine peptidase [Streptomyces sp. DSM 44918]MDT0321165.1 S8 family serine peptidase [Streptomyces sp. DSM 44918]